MTQVCSTCLSSPTHMKGSTIKLQSKTFKSADMPIQTVQTLVNDKVLEGLWCRICPYLMNRLNQTKSTVFKLDTVFPRIPLSDYLEITTVVVVHVAAIEHLPVHQYCIVIFTFSGPLGFHFELERVSLNQGLGGMRDALSASISHEQTQTQSAVFKLWMLYFQIPNLSTLSLLEITTAVVVLCGVIKHLPVH